MKPARKKIRRIQTTDFRMDDPMELKDSPEADMTYTQLESHQHELKTNLNVTVDGKKKERKAVSELMSKEAV